MTLKTSANRKMFYSMGEVSEMFDLPASTLRFWETRFKELSPRKTSKGNRQFTQADIDQIKIIYNLVKERGMTIEGARQAMKNDRGIIKSNLPTIELLQQVRSALMALRDEIDDMVQDEPTPDQHVIIEHVEHTEEVAETTPDETADTSDHKRHFVQHTLFDLGEFSIEETDYDDNW